MLVWKKFIVRLEFWQSFKLFPQKAFATYDFFGRCINKNVCCSSYEAEILVAADAEDRSFYLRNVCGPLYKPRIETHIILGLHVPD